MMGLFIPSKERPRAATVADVAGVLVLGMAEGLSVWDSAGRGFDNNLLGPRHAVFADGRLEGRRIFPENCKKK